MLAVALIGCVGEEPFDPTPCAPAEVFRITGIELPTNNTRARELGFDLVPDDRKPAQPDNHLGMVAATLQSSLGPPLDLSASATAHVGDDVGWQLALRRCPGDQVVVAVGAPATMTADDVQMIGASIDGRIEARGQGGEVPMAALFDPLGQAGPGWQPSLVTMTRFADPGAGAQLIAQLGFATPAAPTAEAIIAAMTPYLAALAVDQPWLLEYLDPDRDGVITEAEVADSSLAAALFAADLRIDSDRANALSLGLQVTATRVP